MTRPSARRAAAILGSGVVALSSMALVATPAQAAPAPAAPAVAAATAPKLTFSLSRTSMTAGQSISARGKITPNRSGYYVTLQRKSGTKWQSLATKKVTSKGTYAVAARLTRGGTNGLRVALRKGGKTVRVSAMKRVNVYAWHYLYDLDTVTNDYYKRGSVSINGRYYPKSFYDSVWSDSNTAEWNLGRKCTTFSAVAGQDDDSSSTNQRNRFEVYGDSARLWTRDIGFGAGVPVTANISGALRLKLADSPLTTNGYRYVAWGDARVLCRF